MKRFSFYILCLVMLPTFVSCSKELDYELPYLGDKLVINGILTPSQVISLRVSKTAPVSSNLSDNLGIDNAMVALYEGGVFLENLISVDTGTYISPSAYKPVAGKSYFVRVSAAGFPDVETMPEKVPLPVTIDKYDFQEAIKSRLNEYNPTRKLMLAFTDDPAQEDYYSIEVQGYYQGYRVAHNVYYLDKPMDADDPCGFLSSGGNLRSGGSILQYNLTDICFNGNTYRVNFGVETRGFPQDGYLEKYPDFCCDVDIDLITVSMKKVSKIYSEYLKTGNQPEGFFLAFMEPNVMHSNVKGGLGLLAAYNEYKLNINL